MVEMLLNDAKKKKQKINKTIAIRNSTWSLFVSVHFADIFFLLLVFCAFFRFHFVPFRLFEIRITKFSI